MAKGAREIDLVEIVLSRIKEYDRNIIRERLTRARAKFEEAVAAYRKVDWCCWTVGEQAGQVMKLWPLGIEVDSIIRPLISCKKPTIFGSGFCPEHFELLDPEDRKRYESPLREFVARFDSTITARVEYLRSDIFPLLKGCFLVHIIDDNLHVNWINAGGNLSAHVIPDCDVDDDVSGYPLTLVEWERHLKDAGIITDDDTAWMREAARFAEDYVFYRIREGLDAVIEQVLRESVFFSFNEAMSAAQRQRFLGQFWRDMPWPCWGEDVQTEEKRRGRKPLYNLSRLLLLYERILPFWQSASEDCQKAQNHPIKKKTWFEAIKAAYKPYDLPADLVARLVDPPAFESHLPPEQAAYFLEKLIEKGGTSKPSDLALEHAARECGTPPYTYALTTLQGILTDLRR